MLRFRFVLIAAAFLAVAPLFVEAQAPATATAAPERHPPTAEMRRFAPVSFSIWLTRENGMQNAKEATADRIRL